MEVARPLIQERMEQFEGDQIRFNLLALCKSPLLTKPEELAVNARSLEALEAHLDAIKPDWRVFENETPESANIVRGPDPNFLLTPGLFESSAPPRSFIEKLSSLKKDTGGLMALRDDLVKTNGILKMEIVDEIRAVDQDKERAVSRRHDYTPAIHAWIRFLADGGALEELLGKAK
jgi:ubiquitin carboxyl-terminal hydrolase L5